MNNDQLQKGNELATLIRVFDATIKKCEDVLKDERSDQEKGTHTKRKLSEFMVTSYGIQGRKQFGIDFGSQNTVYQNLNDAQKEMIGQVIRAATNTIASIIQRAKEDFEKEFKSL